MARNVILPLGVTFQIVEVYDTRSLHEVAATREGSVELYDAYNLTGHQVTRNVSGELNFDAAVKNGVFRKIPLTRKAAKAALRTADVDYRRRRFEFLENKQG